jgi:hypothetical protein
MRSTDASDFLDTDTWARLRRVKTAYDPMNPGHTSEPKRRNGLATQAALDRGRYVAKGT